MSPVPAAERIDIFGVQFDTLDQAAVVATIMGELRAGRGGWVATPNVDIMRQLKADPELARLVAEASLVIVDGAPIEWAGRAAGHAGVPRVAGASLVGPLISAAALDGVPVLLLGGRPGAGERAAELMRQHMPGLRVGEHCPPYGFEADLTSWAELVRAVAAWEGGVVLCGFGCPKQERLMAELSVLFPGTWFLGIGGTIDFLAGEVRRAPVWVQRVGFEWAFRLVMEPRRLARRYLVDGMPFVVRLLAWAARERMHGRAAGHVEVDQPTGPRVAVIPAPRRESAPATPVIDRIDLDRRIVTLVSPGPGGVRVDLDFEEYRAAVARGALLAGGEGGSGIGAPASTVPRPATPISSPEAPRRAVVGEAGGSWQQP
jgi:N-acetylglucosaminyldiphosphoundecaprenol N-acetyl-beta-D-mannosaminyltransferase